MGFVELHALLAAAFHKEDARGLEIVVRVQEVRLGGKGPSVTANDGR